MCIRDSRCTVRRGISVSTEAGVEKRVGVVQLVPESLAQLVDQDQVLKVAHRQSGRSSLSEHRAARLPLEVVITETAADVLSLLDRIAALGRLVAGGPQRRPD